MSAGSIGALRHERQRDAPADEARIAAVSAPPMVTAPVCGTSPHTASQHAGLAGAVGADEAQPASGRHARATADGRTIRSPYATADLAERQVAHTLLRRVRSSRMKNGAPKNAVTTPMGVSAGFCSMRPGTSARIRKAAPTTDADAAARRRYDPPNTIRTACGTMMPTNADQPADADDRSGTDRCRDDDDDAHSPHVACRA